MKNLFFFLCFIFSASLFACEGDQDLTVVYINGVINTQSGAEYSLHEIQKISQSLDLKQKVCFETFYNPSLGPIDLIETIDQKLTEQFIFKLRYYLSFNWWTLHFDFYPRLKQLINIGPVLIVSHSQGNLFARELYRILRDENSEALLKSKFANLQVASTLFDIEQVNTNYITLKEDRIVKLLGPTALNANYSAPDVYDYDILGHQLLETYLNPFLTIDDGSHLSMEELFIQHYLELIGKISN